MTGICHHNTTMRKGSLKAPRKLGRDHDLFYCHLRNPSGIISEKEALA
jgi:hypothetical protein